MNNEIERPRELKFKCPECRSNELIAAVAGWLEIDHVYDDGVFTWSDIRIKQFEDVHCSGCGYEIEEDEDEGWIGWLITHCDQEGSDTRQSEDHTSTAPPSEVGK